MKTITTKTGKTYTWRSMQEGDANAILDYITELGNEDTFILIGPNDIPSYEYEIEYVTNTVKSQNDKKVVKVIVFHGEKIIASGDVKKGILRQSHLGTLGISVRKAYRGQGLGRKIIELLEKEAKEKLDTKLMYLSCFVENTIAQKLYESCGYKQCGVKPKAVQYKGKLQDEITYYKEI